MTESTPGVSAPLSKPRFAAVDFETFYDSARKYSLRNLSPYAYTNDPLFDPYMVSIVTDEGEEYVGSPEQYDWRKLEGFELCMHNAAFDGMVLNRLIELRKAPEFKRELVDTAVMCAYLRYPRALAKAVYAIYGVKLDKAIRSDMDGKRLFDADREGTGEALRKYALDDSRWCIRLYKDFGPQFPDDERLAAKLNREAGWYGVHVDRDAVAKGLAKLKAITARAEENMPWVADGEKPLSTGAFAKHARHSGIAEVPGSLKRDSPSMVAWVAEHGDTHPFIQARLEYASASPHIARLEAMTNLMDGNDLLRFDLLQCGTHTGRVTAGREEGEESGGKFNPLNIPKKPVFGVAMREMLTARPGHKFLIYDYAQIEARVVQWLAGNTKFLKLLETEPDPYQAYAKLVGWYDGDNLKRDDPGMRQLAKSCVAEETLIRTRRGYKRVDRIEATDEVWDGTEWVNHTGLVCNGRRDDCVSVNNERFTPDHELFIDETSKLRADELSAGGGAPALAWRESSIPVSGWHDLWQLTRAIADSLAAEALVLFRMRMSKLRNHLLSLLTQHPKRGDDTVRKVRAPNSAGTLRGAAVGEETR